MKELQDIKEREQRRYDMLIKLIMKHLPQTHPGAKDRLNAVELLKDLESFLNRRLL